MKKYVVMRVYKYVVPSVVFESDSEENARAYANVMRSEHPDDVYAVAMIVEG